MTDDVQDRTIEDAGENAEASPDSIPTPAGKIPTVRPAVERRPSAASVRRQAKKEMSRRAAEARRKARQRRQMLTYSAVAGVVVILLVGGFLLLNPGSKKKPSAASGASASASASATASAVPTPSVSAPAALSAKPTLTKGDGAAPTALKVTNLVTGTGPKVTAGQTITVNYVGVTWADGTEFDSSWSRNEQASFQIGAGKVIPGWDQGLVGVTVGSRVQLDIPSDLAYGDSPTGGQPAGALIFVVDVLAAQ